MVARVIVFAVVCTMAQLAWSGEGPAHVRFQTATGSVRADHYTASGDVTRPAVIILSGARGYQSGAYAELARQLNRRGIDAYLLHYLTADDLDRILSLSKTGGAKAFIAERSPAWNQDLQQSLAAIRKASLHHSERIGVFGLSLGAMVSLRPSSQVIDVDAIAIVAGTPLSNQHKTVLAVSAPVYLAWGSDDDVFSLTSGIALREKLLQTSRDVVLDAYQGEGHQFFLLNGNKNGAVAMGKIVDFFAKNLKAPVPPQNSSSQNSQAREF